MEKIVMRLEYKCFPMWIYNDATFVDNDLVKELEGDKAIDDLLVGIQDKYNSLFTDSGIEFHYNGFLNENDKVLFEHSIAKAVQYIENKVGNKYVIEQKIEL